MIISKGKFIIPLAILAAIPFRGVADPGLSAFTDPGLSAFTDPGLSAFTPLEADPTRGEGFQAEASALNPASMPWFARQSLVRADVAGDWSDTGTTLPCELGNGQLTATIGAASYRRLDTRSTVWGSARFVTGKNRDITWNNATDYELLAPYVIGDATGGDLSRRSYDFRGGYAGLYGRWSWGVEAGYRASIDYRGRDPRDKLIVSDLNVALGGTLRPASAPYSIGLTVRSRVYKQSADVEFYNPINDIDTYAMTGLGAIYPRFSGNSTEATAYTGLGFSGAVSLFPTHSTASPLRASVEASTMRMRQYLRDFNNLELTHTSTTQLRADFGWLRGNYGIIVSGAYSGRNGTENLLGPSTGNNYPKVGERRNYESRALSASVSLPCQWSLGLTDRLEASLSAGYLHTSQKLLDPKRRLAAGYVAPEANVAWSHGFGRTVMRLSGEVSHRFVPGAGAERPDVMAVEEPMRQPLERLTEVTLSEATRSVLGASVCIPVGSGVSLQTSLQWRHTAMNALCGSADAVTLSVGVIL